MNAVGKLGSYISRGVVTVAAPFHPFGGAVDIVVVEQKDGSFKSSPWYVQFGKFQGVLKAREKVVSINVNGVDADFRMYLDSRGGAYFLREVDGEEGVSESDCWGNDTAGMSSIRRPKKIMSFNYDLQRTKLISELEASDAKVVTRSTSTGPRILGFIFGRRSEKDHALQQQENAISRDRGGSLERAEIAADLLEVRWSTSLSTRKQRKGNVTCNCDPQSSVDGGIQKLSSVHNDIGSKTVSSMLARASGFCNSSSHLGSVCINDECDAEIPLSTEPLNYMESFTLEETYLEVNVVPESSVGSNEGHNGIIQNDESADKSDASEISYSNSFVERLAELKSDAGGMSSGDEQSSNFQILQAGNGSRLSRVQSLYCETSESFTEGLDGSSGESSENLCFTCSVSRKMDVPAQALCNSREMMSEVNSEFPSSVSACEMDKNIDNLQDRDPSSSVDGSNFDAVTPDGVETLLKTKVEVILDCRSNEWPLKYVEVVDKVSSSQEPSLTNSLLIEELTGSSLDSIENLRSERPCSARPIGSCRLGSCENLGNLVTSGNGCNRDVLHVHTVDAAVSEQFLSSDLEISGPQRSESMGFRSSDSISKEGTSEDYGVSNEDKLAGLPETLNEGQFFFSDLDESEPTENNSEYYPDSCEENLDESSEMLEELHSFTGQLIQEALPDGHPSTTEMSRTISSPISITTVYEQVDHIAPTVESLPSSWSHGAEMNAQGVNHRTSHSLDLSFDNMRLVPGDIPTTSETGIQEQKSTPRQSSLEHSQFSEELRKILSDPAVEISLCRHLLYEGMGHEAAARAFDAEKLDMEKFVCLGPGIIKNDKVVVRIGGLYFPWHAALPIISAIGAPRGEQVLEPKGIITVDQVEKAAERDSQQSIDSGKGSWRLWPFRRTKSINRRPSIVMNATENQKGPEVNTMDTPADSQRGPAGNMRTPRSENTKKKLVRAKTPTSEQLASLNLKEGKNEVIFTFSTSMLGEQKVDARIFLWKWNSRIVISDVDGTITKSDVLGQFMPMVGIDWSQTGVTHLFSGIKENGYELLFLSARAISQASLTRQFLFSLKQDGKALPEGPVVISPDGLFPSLFREVIRRAPHEFKIACLEDIKALFPPDHSPFYAGFGNRDTDEISYLKVGIPKGKIFIINPRGEVAVHRRIDTRSYSSLHTLVHDMFPPPCSVPSTEQEDFNSWNFWRLPPPEIV